MIEEIFSGITGKVKSIDPNPPTVCICWCFCHAADPEKDDTNEDDKREA